MSQIPNTAIAVIGIDIGKNSFHVGDIDFAEMLAIMSLRPTIADIERASVWLEGDPDVFGAGEAVQGVASDIIAILTENEEEEPPRAG